MRELFGLASFPRATSALLIDAAHNGAQAATLLVALVETRADSLSSELERLESEGDRLKHELTKAVRRGRVADVERGTLLALAEALDDTVDAMTEAGHIIAGCDCGSSAYLLAGVLRDIARTEVKVIEVLSGSRANDRAAQLRRAHELAEEGRRILRHALGEAIGQGTEPMLALRTKRCLDHLAVALDAEGRAVHRTDRAVSGM